MLKPVCDCTKQLHASLLIRACMQTYAREMTSDLNERACVFVCVFVRACLLAGNGV